MTAERRFKKRVRERMKVTGEKYTQARRALEEADSRAFDDSLDREDHPGDRNVGEARR